VSKKSSRAIKEFLGEAEEIIENLNLDLVALTDQAETGECDPDLLNRIFRGAHSLKGLSGMFGFVDISDLSHRMENLLDSLRLGKVALSSSLVEVLFEALEVLIQLVNGKGESEEFSLDLSGIFLKIERALQGETSSTDDPFARYGIDPSILSVLTEYEEHRLLENLKKGRNLLRVKTTFNLTSFDQDLAEITDQLKHHGEVVSTLPCPGDISEQICFQLLYGTEKSAEQIQDILQRDDAVCEMLVVGGSSASAQPKSQTPTPAPVTVDGNGNRSEEPSTEVASASMRSISRTVRVDIDKLDSLMNIVGELVLSKSAISNICELLKESGAVEAARELQKATRNLERRLDDLQKGVMEVRMVPVAQLFEKMIRIVRRLSNEQGKKIDVDIRGAETELDKLIVEDLSDPLMHLIRNAIDHGVEEPEERRQIGKPERGKIALWASQKGNHVVLEIHDDGRGIDPEKVRRKAVEKGLISETNNLSREEVFDLIMSPGFSTRDEVSEISGRGVGMDVVKNNISALSGMIEMTSEVGKGTTMIITLPITLAIIKALIVRVAGKTYAIPINSVQETLMIPASALKTIEDREVIELRESTLPLLRLTDIFGLAKPDADPSKLFVAVVGLAEKKAGIVVDDLLGQQDVVIKSLGNALSFVRGIAGAADLGNQKTILVLDVGGLMAEALKGESAFYYV